MDIDRSDTGNVEHRLGQNQTVSGHQQKVGFQLRQGGDIGRGLKIQRLPHFQAVLHGQFLNRRGLQTLAAAGRPVGLGIYGQHFAVGPGQHLVQNDGGKVRGAHEHQFEFCGFRHALFIYLERRNGKNIRYNLFL